MVEGTRCSLSLCSSVIQHPGVPEENASLHYTCKLDGIRLREKTERLQYLRAAVAGMDGEKSPRIRC